MKKLTVHGVELACVDEGAGLPVVLVHGFPLDHTMWDAQVSGLRNRYRVIVPDLRGFGASDASQGTVTMEQFADDLVGLLDALEIDQPVVLVGLSMGGYVALQFFQHHRRWLRGLVLCDTRAETDTAEAAAARHQTADRVLSDGPAALVAGMPAKLLAPTTLEKHREIIRSIGRAIEAADPQGIAAASRGMAQRSDTTGLLAQIDCPTLVVVGVDDAITPPGEMAAMAAAIPGSRLVEIPEAGHMTPLENPAAVNAALEEFLAAL